MKTRAFQLAAVVCIAVGASQASSAPILELTVTPEPGSTTIALTVTNDAGERPGILGFHIYRDEFTGENQLPDGNQESCVNRVRLTDDFLPRPFGPSSYSFQIKDGALAAGRAYRYSAEGYPRLVPPWDWWVGFDIEKSWVALTTGQTLIASSTRLWERDAVMGLDPCGCFTWVFRVASAPSEIVHTGVWTLYGTIRPRADSKRFEVVVDSAVPQECLDLAVVPSTWAIVKSLYR